jgi:hypothetical protein
MDYGTGILSYVLLPVTSHMEMIYLSDILDILDTVPLYPYRYGTATYACLA